MRDAINRSPPGRGASVRPPKSDQEGMAVAQYPTASGRSPGPRVRPGPSREQEEVALGCRRGQSDPCSRRDTRARCRPGTGRNLPTLPVVALLHTPRLLNRLGQEQHVMLDREQWLARFTAGDRYHTVFTSFDFAVDIPARIIGDTA